jgi:hypothetical protein
MATSIFTSGRKYGFRSGAEQVVWRNGKILKHQSAKHRTLNAEPDEFTLSFNRRKPRKQSECNEVRASVEKISGKKRGLIIQAVPNAIESLVLQNRKNRLIN